MNVHLDGVGVAVGCQVWDVGVSILRHLMFPGALVMGSLFNCILEMSMKRSRSHWKPSQTAGTQVT